MKLPNGDHALVDIRKLLEYCLNPQHPRGRNKARVFASVGIREADAEELSIECHLRDGSRCEHLALALRGGLAGALEADTMSAATEYAVEMDGITRRFGDFVAVDQVTLKIPKGRLYGFLGLNGAGKTTTIRVLTTLLPPSAGVARLWGHDVVKDPLAVRRLVGLVSDETSESQSTWTARESGLSPVLSRACKRKPRMRGERAGK